MNLEIRRVWAVVARGGMCVVAHSKWTALAGLFFMVTWTAAAQTGAISLTVDATQTPLKVIRTQETIPVKPGPLTLYYPKWIPGEHGPDGPIGNVTGLKFTANGATIPWQRDLSDVFTFHVEVPAGVNELHVAFDYLEPSGAGGFTTSAMSATDKLIVIEWNQNVFLSRRTPCGRDPVSSEACPAGRVEVRDAATRREPIGKRSLVRASFSRTPRRFARDCGAVLPRD